MIAKGTVCAIARIDPLTVELQPLNGSTTEQVSLTNGEFHGFLNEGSFSIVYGYFGSRQAARRATAGRRLLSCLPLPEHHGAIWRETWSETFLAAEAAGEVTRSDRSCTAFIPELQRQVAEKLRHRDATFPDALLRKPPCRTSLMAWVRQWEHSRDPIALVKRSRFNGKNARRIDADQEAILQERLPEYLHPNRPSISGFHSRVNADIRKRNQARQLAGAPLIEEISESTIRRRIAALGRFEICAAREGVVRAKNRYGAHGFGLQIDVPLQRVEIDEWEIDLMAILADGGADVTTPSLRDLALGRCWVCVALDAATRCTFWASSSPRPHVSSTRWPRSGWRCATRPASPDSWGAKPPGRSTGTRSTWS